MSAVYTRSFKLSASASFTPIREPSAHTSLIRIQDNSYRMMEDRFEPYLHGWDFSNRDNNTSLNVNFINPERLRRAIERTVDEEQMPPLEEF